MNSIEKAMALLDKVGMKWGGDRKGAATSGPSTAGRNRNANARGRCIDLEQFKNYSTENDQERRLLEEEYRAIKRPILNKSFGEKSQHLARSNLVAVVSSLPGEGKTLTTLNLALSIAMEQDSTVMLIDGDMIRRNLSKILGVDRAPGLIEVLEGKKDISEVLYSTSIEKLKVVPAGADHDYSTELLSSKRMEQLASELSERYGNRIILIDSTPVLMTSQAAALIHHVGQTLVVVEAGKTPQAALQQTLSVIKNESAIGMILTKRDRITAVGGDYYGAYYGRYYTEGKKGKG
ncbi:MAG: AAA family ATPase [Gammaproteobacteria bacterium]|nr:AAA family ATPase [Gammaproteobacteria bacterium]